MLAGVVLLESSLECDFPVCGAAVVEMHSSGKAVCCFFLLCLCLLFFLFCFGFGFGFAAAAFRRRFFARPLLVFFTAFLSLEPTCEAVAAAVVLSPVLPFFFLGSEAGGVGVAGAAFDDAVESVASVSVFKIVVFFLLTFAFAFTFLAGFEFDFCVVLPFGLLVSAIFFCGCFSTEICFVFAFAFGFGLVFSFGFGFASGIEAAAFSLRLLLRRFFV